VSDHFDGRRFFNPAGMDAMPFSKVPRMLFTRRTPWPRRVPVTRRPLPAVGPGDIAITWVGHSTFLFQTDRGNFLTDPVWSERASPVQFAGPRRVRDPGLSLDALPDIAMVLVSHNHYDHFDRSTLRVLEQRYHPLFVTPLGNAPLLRTVGARRIIELDWWQAADGTPVPVTLTPAQHFSARTPFDRNRALWGGFALQIGGRLIYFAGDSGYGPHFKQIRAQLGAPDLALLPIGAYEPRWFMQAIHMNPAEAVRTHLDLESRLSVAMHFGTIQLTPEGIDEPVRDLGAAAGELGVPPDRFRVLDVGESLLIH